MTRYFGKLINWIIPEDIRQEIVGESHKTELEPQNLVDYISNAKFTPIISTDCSKETVFNRQKALLNAISISSNKNTMVKMVYKGSEAALEQFPEKFLVKDVGKGFLGENDECLLEALKMLQTHHENLLVYFNKLEGYTQPNSGLVAGLGITLEPKT